MLLDKLGRIKRPPLHKLLTADVLLLHVLKGLWLPEEEEEVSMGLRAAGDVLVISKMKTMRRGQ